MRHLIYILVAMATLASLGACTLETSDNGHLDGFWHLTRVDTLATGTTEDMSQRRLFWSVQLTLIDMRDADGNHSECISHFEMRSDSLFLFDEYLYDRTQGDVKIENADPLRPFGINRLGEKFQVQQLSSDRMTLQSDVVRLRFEKM